MEVGSVTVPVTIEVEANQLIVQVGELVRFDSVGLTPPEIRLGQLVGDELIRFDFQGHRTNLYIGVAARVQPPGDPLRYDSGPEYRDQDGLKQLVDQLPGKPLTLYHPDGLIRDGATAKVIGKVVSAKLDGGRAVVIIQVTHQDGVAAIEDGTRELSVGYSCSLDDSRTQRNIKVDHLAVVPHARCGPTCRIDGSDEHHDHAAHADCGCGCGGTCKIRAVSYPADVMDPVTENLDTNGSAKGPGGHLDNQENKMEELQKQLDAIKADLEAQKTRADQAQQQVEKLTLERDIAVKDAKAEKTRADNLQTEVESQKTRADQAEEAAKTAGEKARADAEQASKANFDAAVAARAELIAQATSIVKDDKVDFAKMDGRDIKIAVIKHVDGDDVAPEASIDYVNGMYASAVKRHATVAASVNGARQQLQQMRSDSAQVAAKSGRDAERAAQVEMANRARTAWNKQNQ